MVSSGQYVQYLFVWVSLLREVVVLWSFVELSLFCILFCLSTTLMPVVRIDYFRLGFFWFKIKGGLWGRGGR